MSRQALTVNGEILPHAEIRTLASSVRLEQESLGQELNFEQRAALVEEARERLIDRMLLAQEARRLSLTPTASELDSALAEQLPRLDGAAGCRAGMDTAEIRDEMSRSIMIDKLLNRWKSRVRRPGRAELQEHYRAHREQFFEPEAVHVSHIVRHFESDLNSEAAYVHVTELRQRVANGEAFATVATRYSDCPENGGDLGWFARGVMVAAFENEVFTAPVAELTPVFQTEFGFHFALVHGRKAAGVLSFDEVRPQLENSLWLRRQDAEVGRALEALRAKAVIEGEP
jgi:parvulin-like peptidyl-prolyl isomerase